MGKVLIAMSGGVDSSVAAYLLKHSGWDCVGATMTLYRNEDIGRSSWMMWRTPAAWRFGCGFPTTFLTSPMSSAVR